MLRVRPIHFTSSPDSWERLLTALGMSPEDLSGQADDAGRRVFAAGSGRLVLQAVAAGSAEDGTTTFSVEVGDPAEFARRTNLAATTQEPATAQGTATAGATAAQESTTGNAALARPSADGGSCRITAPDGFTFTADKAPATDKAPGTHQADGAAPSGDTDPALTVVGVWFTPDPAGAAATLRHIGARPRPVPDNDETADFTAKNGGVLLARPASGEPRGGFGFEYDGGQEPLRKRLAAAGFIPVVTEEAFGATIHVTSPDSGTGHAPETVWISLRHPMR